MKAIGVRDLGNDCARIVHEVENGETFTVISDGRPVASITPYTAPNGPQTWVPAHRAIGALAHLNLPADFAEQLRTDIVENLDDELGDPFERWERLHTNLADDGEEPDGA